MNSDYHAILVRVSRLFGPWLFVVVSRIIATGYFLFSPRVRESCRLYAALFPHRRKGYHLWCTFRQYQNFTTIHFDRFLGNQGRAPGYICHGGEHLETRLRQGGAILLMSHLGNWEMAARLLMAQRQDLRLLLYMGIKEKEGVERTQKEELRRAGVTIIGADQGSASPFSAVEGVRLLQAGGLVSMTGDIVWRADQRRIAVRFLDGIAYVPEAPFIFALVSGAPILVFFAFRTGANRYRFTLSEPISIRAASKAERQRVIGEAAQQYADLLEGALRASPFEWYHFDRFRHASAQEPEGA
ncbi:MAG: lysophospholipid acyltransferase family protein [Desulfobulbaceae bacterium]|nr:lysophospholipid acyltransferase family protein [Desulfobulbaceae bacterium]